ncbi:MAG TPA: hypothetical protein VM030_04475 [Acidimicrobiales bacterium]|nr:hypothetical protein [Acidimicrobiales bacterium]
MRAPDAPQDWSKRHPIGWRLAILFMLSWMVPMGWIVFVFGGCHDTGGFCTDDFGANNIALYASGAAVFAVCGAGFTLLFTRRPRVVVGVAAATAVAAAFAAFYMESSPG